MKQNFSLFLPTPSKHLSSWAVFYFSPISVEFYPTSCLGLVLFLCFGYHFCMPHFLFVSPFLIFKLTLFFRILFFLYKQAQVSPILRTNYSTTCPSLTFTHPSILSFKVKLSLRCLLFPLMITPSLLNPFLVFTPFILWKRFLLLCSVP